MIKLHATVDTFKVKKSSVQYLRASKIWLASDDPEPYTGISLLGGESYWKDVITEFEKIVKMNSCLRFHSNPIQGQGQTEEYREVFAATLKTKQSRMLLTVRCSGDRKDILPSSTDYFIKSFDLFCQYVEGNELENKEDILSTVRTLAAGEVSYFDIRKIGLLHFLTNTKEQFELYLEMRLMGVLSHLSQKGYVPPSIFDISSALNKFLEYDQVFEGQLNESKKMFSKEKEGSLSYVGNAFVIINNLVISTKGENRIDNHPERGDQDLINSQIKNGYFLSSNPEIALRSCGTIPKKKSDLSLDHFTLFEKIKVLEKKIEVLEKWKCSRMADDHYYIERLEEMIKTANKSFVRSEEKASNKRLPSANGAEPTTAFVKLTIADGSDVHEFPTDKDGNLSNINVKAIFPGRQFCFRK